MSIQVKAVKNLLSSAGFTSSLNQNIMSVTEITTGKILIGQVYIYIYI